MTTALPVWRSMLFVPATNEKLVESATNRHPDAFQIDLEDAVPPELKREARTRVRDVATRIGRNGADVLVRINRPLRLALADLEASICPEVFGLNLPKVPNAAYVREIEAVVTELERENGMKVGHTRFLVMVETAAALPEMPAIAMASPRVVAMTIGAEDLALDMGMVPEEEPLFMPNVQLVAAARAAGILPIGYLTSVANYSDLEAFRAVVARSRKLGFEGGFCIHPRQIEILNEEFSPGAEQLAEAAELVNVYAKALAEGKGAVAFRNKMIDQPVAHRAQAMLDRHQAILNRLESRPPPAAAQR